MKLLLIIPVLILVLGSCTMNDLSAKRINQPKIPSGVQSFSGTVLPETKETLIMAYSEELLAHDIYTKIVEKYPNLAEIKNIVSSEILLDRLAMEYLVEPMMFLSKWLIRV